MQIIYGIHAVQSFIKHKSQSATTLHYDERRNDQRLKQLIQLAQRQEVNCLATTSKKLDVLATGERHQGAVLETNEQHSQPALEDLLTQLDEPAFLLVLDGITDPHNLGACLRTADAAGVHAVIFPKDKSASINATVRKVACGAAETIPTYPVTNLARTLEQLQQWGIWIIGTTGEADQELYELDLSGPKALVMGAEGSGMRRLTKEKCDHLAKLPMAGSVSSLNVSVATGVCLFEMVRQRNL
ncbi:MAG: 23S rRNA (guanosine(2251)-2'-O)-methyltransferase RlmB [Sinobacterium sp.]|nr:23S rRNA (guanosine(2251)-2'-O)-methyltransferase RlmB [Sinobacterium sp.]